MSVFLTNISLPILEVLDELCDQLDGAVDAEYAAVDGQIVAVCPPPLLGGIIVVIALSGLILFGHHVDGLLLRGNVVVALHDAFDLALLIRMDEEVQAVLVIVQRIVRASADDHARPLVRDLLDRVELRQKHLVADRHIHEGGGIIAEGIGVHHQIIEEGVGGTLVVVLNHLLAETALLRRPRQELFIVKFNAEIVGYLLSDLAAARAELPTDGNDRIHRTISPFCHEILSLIQARKPRLFRYLYYIRFSMKTQTFKTISAVIKNAMRSDVLSHGVL